MGERHKPGGGGGGGHAADQPVQDMGRRVTRALGVLGARTPWRDAKCSKLIERLGGVGGRPQLELQWLASCCPEEERAERGEPLRSLSQGVQLADPTSSRECVLCAVITIDHFLGGSQRRSDRAPFRWPGVVCWGCLFWGLSRRMIWIRPWHREGRQEVHRMVRIREVSERPGRGVSALLLLDLLRNN